MDGGEYFRNRSQCGIDGLSDAVLISDDKRPRSALPPAAKQSAQRSDRPLPISERERDSRKRSEEENVGRPRRAAGGRQAVSGFYGSIRSMCKRKRNERRRRNSCCHPGRIRHLPLSLQVRTPYYNYHCMSSQVRFLPFARLFAPFSHSCQEVPLRMCASTRTHNLAVT